MGHFNPSNGRRQLPGKSKAQAEIQALHRVNGKLVGEVFELRKQRRSALLALAAFVAVHGEEDDDGTAVYTLKKDVVSKLTGAEYVTIKGEDGKILISVRQATEEERQRASGPSRIIIPPGASVN